MSEAVNGIENFDTAIQSMSARVDRGALDFVKQGQQVVAKYAKEMFIGGEEAAATDTWRSDAWPLPTRRSGALQASIGTTVIVEKTGPGSYSSSSGPTTVYARRIELGYHGTGRWPHYSTRPFPFMKPGLEKSQPDLDALFNKLVLSAQEA
jgi:hypothetical protein